MSQQPCKVDIVSTVINKKKKEDMYKLKFINWLELLFNVQNTWHKLGVQSFTKIFTHSI